MAYILYIPLGGGKDTPLPHIFRLKESFQQFIYSFKYLCAYNIIFKLSLLVFLQKRKSNALKLPLLSLY